MRTHELESSKILVGYLPRTISLGSGTTAPRRRWPHARGAGYKVRPQGDDARRCTRAGGPRGGAEGTLPARRARGARADHPRKELTSFAFTIALTQPRSGRRLTKSELHRMLKNPIYYSDFQWKGTLCRGSHIPIISRDLFDAGQLAFASTNRPRYSKHQHAFYGTTHVRPLRLRDHR